jgi:hypothetical protein
VEEYDIELGGITNLEDLLNELPQLFAMGTRSSNNPGFGASVLSAVWYN